MTWCARSATTCSIWAGSPYQNDHEDANGQFEMNWEFDDALATADKHSFFKFMVKSVAEKHGFARPSCQSRSRG
jgi:glutamine synthetase